MNVLAVDQITSTQLEALFLRADALRQLTSESERRKLATRHVGKQLCSLFYEPSTRTRLSSETAAVKMGMGLVSTENAREFSSSAKGETIEDTVRNLNEYHYDIIVMRHHETGAAKRAGKVSTTPIINAGDGKGEHPTQALLDAYTIYRRFGRLNNPHIVMGGDLAHGRTVRSLAQLLSKHENNTITFVSVPELQIGSDIKKILRQRKTSFNETSDMESAFKNADIVYWTRLQKERLENPDAVPKNGFVINRASIKTLPKTAVIMHPLPRVDEINSEIDDDPRAIYFEQAGNGLYLRMALIDSILDKTL